MNTPSMTNDKTRHDDERVLVRRTSVADVYWTRRPGSGEIEYVVERFVSLSCDSQAQAELLANPLVHCVLLAPDDVALVGRRDPSVEEDRAFEVTYVESGETLDENAAIVEPGSLITEYPDGLGEAWDAFTHNIGAERPDDDEIVTRIVGVTVTAPMATRSRRRAEIDDVDLTTWSPAGSRRYDA